MTTLSNAVKFLRDRGLRAALRRAVSGMDRNAAVDLWAEYAFALGGPVGDAGDALKAERASVNWVMPPFAKNSGGHQNICRFAHMLEQRGYRTCIVVSVGEWFGTPDSVRERIREWFFPLQGEVAIGIDNAPPANVTIATGWTTAYDVRRFQATRHRAYFVQDYEPAFHGAGSKYALSEETYRFGFRGITAGGWLEKKLASEYGMVTDAVGFSCDRQIYKPYPRRDRTRRVLFYGRPSSERRAFELGVLALGRMASRHPDVEVVFVGGSLGRYKIPFRHRCEGVLDFEGLARLYSECDAALVLSMTNLSLLPLELMACGVPVISNRAPCTEWLLHDDIAELASPTVEQLSDAVCHVLENVERREHLRSSGLSAAAATSWEAEGDKLASIIRSLE